MNYLMSVIITLGMIVSFSYAQVEKKEIDKEIKRLEQLKSEVKALIDKNNALLESIKEERAKLKQEKEEFKNFIKKAQEERYKKLGKVFEKMDPEMAGEKISNMKDPVKAAYIIYNMKPRLAGEVMNYVKPEMVDEIVKILTDIKKQNMNISDKN